MIEIPLEMLEPATLQALLEEFVTRQGSIHGHADSPIAEQVRAVRKQLSSGLAFIAFDEETATSTILARAG